MLSGTETIIWYSNAKFKVMDLHESHYDEVITLIKHHFFAEEPLCKSSKLLDDSASVASYLNFIRTWMKDTCSLVAVSAKSGRVIGVAITRIDSSIEKSDTFNRVQVYEGEPLKAIMQLKNSLISQADAYQTFGQNAYLRIYVLSIHPSFKIKGVDSALLKACGLVASNMQIPVVAGIFTSNEHQKLAYHCEYLLISEIFYRNWIIDEKVVFDNTGDENVSAAFMFLSVLDTKMKENKN
ncbi:uncharacterized protein LOC131665910 [Phymastichus coffea]|uniref:uncharacterized protein LOC131665910 n=1 Tax=Phymastichus coffea TaxID=108790 RepID=UPI00273B4CEC|nr:uncharacterized protein LOC131665910 [Phymastichus coffea]